ncbi:pyrroloquinoline quinone-dependent dehydrogenase [Granulicella paludicola]|uniref:pyrroloquinoline quinone-dependent dehydrogenase n=1 Tax=Granulicella paludicola TaxID=474951 RepID=UPI0021DFD19F|nr:pyrroloquinoline quinone-dependent dehydrogenase [Granulicella paludicola]
MRSKYFLLLTMTLSLCLHAQVDKGAGWPEYGGDLAGQRYSSAKQINKTNVGQLAVAWTFHTHAMDGPSSNVTRAASFEATPVLWNGTLYFDSPFDEVFAVDSQTGKLRWRFDPGVKREHLFIVTSRGVALWHAAHPQPGACGADIVLLATLDRRLMALDARTGAACKAFGNAGTIDLTQGVEIARPDLYFFTSPPIVVGDTIVLGSSVADNQQVFAGSGAVRGFDARTGQQRWSWDAVRWTAQQHPKQSGSGNVWTTMAADAEHDLVFLPTSSPSLDYYGATRVGDNRDADSIVALRASTGERVWAYQLVHHDLWDYDVASQPLLFDLHGKVPAVAVTNKTGMIYVFNRLTGKPLYPIEERPVVQSTVPGEVTWPTQPFSTLPPLIPLSYSAADVNGGTEADRSFCRAQLSKLRNDGLFTPPSLEGSLIYPSALGGPNWGSSAFDAASGVMYTRVNVLPFQIHLVKKVKPALWDRAVKKWNQIAPTGMETGASQAFRPPDLGMGNEDMSEMNGVPYKMDLRALVSPDGLPCGPTPYGRIVATNLNTGKQLWSVPHGELKPGVHGSIGVGGTIATAGGLLFAASTNDPYLYAYDAANGRVLWKGKLPATANATPMTYAVGGRQYVAIAVGGHRLGVGDESDTVVVFALPPSHN